MDITAQDAASYGAIAEGLQPVGSALSAIQLPSYTPGILAICERDCAQWGVLSAAACDVSVSGHSAESAIGGEEPPFRPSRAVICTAWRLTCDIRRSARMLL
jgi:hypothetical protein